MFLIRIGSDPHYFDGSAALGKLTVQGLTWAMYTERTSTVKKNFRSRNCALKKLNTFFRKKLADLLTYFLKKQFNIKEKTGHVCRKIVQDQKSSNMG